MSAFAIKAEVGDPQAEAFAFAAQKTIKFYRQATDKLVGLSDAAAAFLGECF